MPEEPDENDFADYFELPFSLLEKELTEELTLQLPISLLDQLDDTRLKLLTLMPRRARPLLTTENIVGFSLKLLIHQNSQPVEEPLLVKQAKSLSEWWAQNNRNSSDPDTNQSD